MSEHRRSRVWIALVFLALAPFAGISASGQVRQPLGGGDRPRPQDEPPPPRIEQVLGAVDAEALRPADGRPSNANEREYRQGIEMVNGGRAEDALALFNLAIEYGGHKRDPVARTYRGRVYLAKEDYGDAVREFNTALRLKPDLAAAGYYRAVALSNLGLYDEALKGVDEAIRRGMNEAGVYQTRGEILLAVGRWSDALADQDRVVALAPQSAKAHWLRAQYLAAVGRDDEARREAQWMADHDPQRTERLAQSVDAIRQLRAVRQPAQAAKDAAAAYAQGNRLFWREEYGDAAIWYARAAELDPRSVEYRAAAAHTSGLAGSPEKEVWYATQALALDPKNASGRAEAHKIRGWGFRNLHNYDLAAAEFTAAVEAEPKYAPAYLSRAQLYQECFVNHNVAAQDDFNKAVELDPRNPQAWHSRGVFLMEWGPAQRGVLGNSPEGAYGPAYANFNEAVKLDPNFALAYVHRGIALAAMGRRDAAKADFDEAFKLEPWNEQKYRKYVIDTLQGLSQATAFGRQLVAELAAGATQTGSPGRGSSSDDGSAARARDKWNRETAMDNASKAGDRGAYERIRNDQSTWRDKSLYGH